jgi:glucose-1-phosphate cytidylyltransferase
MKVVILCGGLGTRLRGDTEVRPKPMVEIGGNPILWHIMKMYQSHGFHEFIICTGYKGHVIKEYFHHYREVNSDFTYSSDNNTITYHNAPSDWFTATVVDTGEHSQTGGRLKRVQRYIEDDTFMMAYGDHVSNVNLRALLEFHFAHGRIATLTAAPNASRFGIMKTTASGLVTDFAEKPVLEGVINIGFFVFNRRVFDYLTDDSCVFEREPLQQLTADQQLMAFYHAGFNAPMDTPRDHEMLDNLWQSENPPWKTWKD